MQNAEAARRQRVTDAQQQNEQRRTDYDAFVAAKSVDAPLDLTIEPDFNIEPEENDRHMEVWLEHKIINELFPAHEQQKDALAKTDADLTFRLAILKARIVGKGRGGKWEEYVETKQFPVCLKTLDRWINDLRDDPKSRLPAWVVERLTCKRRPSTKKIKLSVELVFDNVNEKNELATKLGQLNALQKADVFLNAVRAALKELGL